MTLSFIAGIRAAAAHNAMAPALVSGRRVIGYKDLLDLIARIANILVARQLNAGAKVFINIFDPDIRLATMIAAMHVGLVPFALLDLGDTPGEVDYDLVVGTGERHSPEPVPDLLLDPQSLGAADPVLPDFPDRGADDILFVASTTGSTGRRKLVAEIAGRFERHTAGRSAATSERPIQSSDRVMMTTGDVTKAGIGGALKILTVGATHVRFERRLPECVRLINILRVTRLTATPSALMDLTDAMAAETMACPSLRHIVVTGALLQRTEIERIERHFDAEIWIHYGSSETGMVASGRVTAAAFEPGYVGDVVPGIVLAAAGTPDQPAELVIASSKRASAPYYSKGRLVSERGGALALPDIGYLRGQRIYLVGRDDEVVNFDGNKTAYSIIDAELRAQPGVGDVAIVGAAAIGDSAGIIVAIVADEQADMRGLKATACRAAHAPDSATGHVRLFKVDRIPRNQVGKVDRRAVVHAYTQSHGRVSAHSD